MDLIKAILSHIQKPEIETRDSAPHGLCPVCWGNQQYDGKIRTILKNKQIDINNHKDSHMIIEEFVKVHINELKRKEVEVRNCSACGHDNLGA